MQFVVVTSGRASRGSAYCTEHRTCQGHFLSYSLWKNLASACQHKPADPRLNNSHRQMHAACTSMHNSLLPLGLLNFGSIFLVQRGRLLLYQPLILSTHITEKCPWLPGAQAPRVLRCSQKALRLLNSSDCPGGKERFFVFSTSLSSQQEQGAHPSLNKIHFLFSRIRGEEGRRRRGGKQRGGGGGKGGARETNTWLGMPGK